MGKKTKSISWPSFPCAGAELAMSLRFGELYLLSTCILSLVGSGSFSPPLLNFGNGTHVKDEELALYILKRSSYDWKEALKAYAQCLKGKTKARDLDSSHEVGLNCHIVTLRPLFRIAITLLCLKSRCFIITPSADAEFVDKDANQLVRGRVQGV